MKFRPVFLGSFFIFSGVFLNSHCTGSGLQVDAAKTATDSAPVQSRQDHLGEAVRLIPNFHQVNQDIYRSGRPTKKGVSALKGVGIKTILSVQDYGWDKDDADEEREWARDVNIQFFNVPMHGLKKPTMDQINLALSRLSDPSNYPILVHCEKGSDRTGVVIASYHIKHDGWSIEKAKSDMYAFGHSHWLFWWDSALDHI